MRIKTLFFLICLIPFLFMDIPHAVAATFRVGLIVGNNQGRADRRPLRYAEGDAKNIYETITQVGDFTPNQTFLLLGKNALTFRQTFVRVKALIQNLSRGTFDEVLFLFYFSGHLEDNSLELDDEAIPLKELKEMISSTRAKVKLAILDACHSGAVLRSKGGGTSHAYVPVDLRHERLPEGEIFITSSTESEESYESSETQGSFFTNFFISGLRGGADFNQDGAVTIGEAYPYAAEETLQKTTRLWGKAQHPSYDFKLSGEGEIVLAYLTKGSPTLVLSSSEEGGFFIYKWPSRLLVAEFDKKAGVEKKIALPEGNLLIQRSKGDVILEKDIETQPHGIYMIDWKQASQRPYHPPQRILASFVTGGEKKLLREGNLIPLRLTETVNSKFAHPGDKVSFEATEDVWVDDALIVPAGAPASGEILSVKKRRGLSNGALICKMGYVQAIDGQWIPLNSLVSRVAHGGVMDDPEENLKESDKSTTAIDIASTTAAIFLLPFYPLMQGRHAIIKEGTVFEAYIARDIWISGITK